MKRFLLIAMAAVALCLLVTSCGTSSRISDALGVHPRTVRPLPVTIRVRHLEDGIYPVRFSPAHIRDMKGGFEVPFEVFSPDYYDVLDVHDLVVGDRIAWDGKVVRIDSLRTERGAILINGGIDYGGIDLVPEGGGVYRSQGFDDYMTYTAHGRTRLFVADSLPFADRGNVEQTMEGVVVPAGQVAAYLRRLPYPNFTQYNARIRIERGAVVEFWREYTP